MQLSKDQLRQVFTKLDELWKNQECESCKSNAWTISDRVFEMRAYHPEGALVFGPPTFPAVLAICKVCGNTRVISAVFLGIVEGDKEEDANG